MTTFVIDRTVWTPRQGPPCEGAIVEDAAIDPPEYIMDFKDLDDLISFIDREERLVIYREKFSGRLTIEIYDGYRE